MLRYILRCARSGENGIDSTIGKARLARKAIAYNPQLSIADSKTMLRPPTPSSTIKKHTKKEARMNRSNKEGGCSSNATEKAISSAHTAHGGSKETHAVAKKKAVKYPTHIPPGPKR